MPLPKAESRIPMSAPEFRLELTESAKYVLRILHVRMDAVRHLPDDSISR